MNKQTSSGAITYTIKQGRIMYLLLKHTDGHWGFPKGTLEPGESLLQAAEREIREEAGSDDFELITNNKWTITYTAEDGKIKDAIYFLARINESIKLSEEHTEYGFFEFKEAMEKLEFDDIKQVLRKANLIISERENPIT